MPQLVRCLLCLGGLEARGDVFPIRQLPDSLPDTRGVSQDETSPQGCEGSCAYLDVVRAHVLVLQSRNRQTGGDAVAAP